MGLNEDNDELVRLVAKREREALHAAWMELLFWMALAIGLGVGAVFFLGIFT